MTQTALILGASGKFSRHTTAALRAAGWSIRAFNRQRDDMSAAARGVDLIVNGMNPQGYRNWQVEVPSITARVIAAARTSGATVLVPGNVYTYGVEPAPWSAETPHRPCSVKGRIRAEMEAAYRAAAPEVRTIILRSGDFIDTVPSGNFFDLVLIKAIARGRLSYPGRADIPHAWAYLPDLGRAAAAVIERRHQLPAFADIPYAGLTLSANQMAASLATVLGRDIRVRPMPWWPFQLGAPVWRLGREVLEMRYLWDHPHWLDGTALRHLVPEYRATPLDAALASALPADVHPDQSVVARPAVP